MMVQRITVVKFRKKYAKIDDRIIAITQENKGLSTTRNRGMDIARGEYISFVDSDDYINLNTYEVVYNLAKEHDVDILEFGKRWYQSETEKTIKFEYPGYNKVIENIDKDNVRNVMFDVYVIDKIYKKDFLKEHNLRFVDGMVYEDICFNLMCMPNIKRYEMKNDIFLNYRRREGSITNQGKNYESLAKCINAIEPICGEWRKTGMIEGNEEWI